MAKQIAQIRTQEFIVQLTKLLKLDLKYNNLIAMTAYENNMDANNWQLITKAKNLIKLLAIMICMANATNVNHFIYSIQFNVEELKANTRAIQVPSALEQA